MSSSAPRRQRSARRSRRAWIGSGGRRSTPAWSPGWGRRGSSTGCRSRSPARSPGVLTQPYTLDMTSTEVGLIASVYLIGQLIGALVFGRMSDQLGRKRRGLHVAAVPVGHRARRVRHRTPHRLAGVLLRHPADRRHGHRRPVPGDQLGDRRDDAVKVPGPRRHLDQRLLLGRGDPRLVRLAHLPQRLRRQRRLAPGVPDGPCWHWSSSSSPARCPRAPAGCSPTAASTRPKPNWPRSKPPRARRSRRSTTAWRSSSCRRRSTATCGSCGWCSRRTRSGRSSAPP